MRLILNLEVVILWLLNKDKLFLSKLEEECLKKQKKIVNNRHATAAVWVL